MSGTQYVPIPIIFFALILAAGVYKKIKTRRAIGSTGTSEADIREACRRGEAKKEAELEVEVKKRRAEEEDTTKGKHIWFSRCVQHGRFKHWVLGVEDTKYELRRDDASGKYMANVAPWTIDKEKREAALSEQKIPNVDGYYICLIGWTQKQPQELKQICDEVMAQFGTYYLVFNNCQDFLKTFADRIISETALDWEWFRDNTKTGYQETQALKIPTPDEIIAANRSAAQQQINSHNRHQIHHNMHAMNQAIHHSSQIGLQNQLASLNQVQNQQVLNQQNQPFQMQNPIMMG
ncbi:hypothetical protein F5X98DRAFT_359472 [Xylaria grammica]|nr:hypothetical protein F5X98DRAFT_359472 [Xylaria grammica]